MIGTDVIGVGIGLSRDEAKRLAAGTLEYISSLVSAANGSVPYVIDGEPADWVSWPFDTMTYVFEGAIAADLAGSVSTGEVARALEPCVLLRRALLTTLATRRDRARMVAYPRRSSGRAGCGGAHCIRQIYRRRPAGGIRLARADKHFRLCRALGCRHAALRCHFCVDAHPLRVRNILFTPPLPI